MQFPSARLSFSSNGACSTVYPGSLLGRLAKADVVIPDPRISEAHAMVSLRGRTLRLLALRGGLTAHGREVDALTLEPELQFELAEGLLVTVEGVELPTHSLVLCGTEQGPVELGASTYSLLPADDPRSRRLRLVTGYVPDATGHVWYSGESLWIRLGGQDAEPIQPEGRWTIAGCTLRVILVPLDGIHDTVSGDSGGSVARANLTIVARYTSVHLLRGTVTSVITGRPAVLISELVRFGGKPVPWETLARQVWGDRFDREQLRDNFDATIARLRRQMRELDVRQDLVLLDGSGNVDLVLYPGDRMVDES